MINFLTHQTVEDVFTYNYEALREWRSFLSLPYRSPDAERYFIASRLSNPNVMSSLGAYQPDESNSVRLVFGDGSVLNLPDEIFESVGGYQRTVRKRKLLKHLNAVQQQMHALPQESRHDKLIAKAAKILKSLKRMRSSQHEDVVVSTRGFKQLFMSALQQNLSRVQLYREVLRLVNRAHELETLLPPKVRKTLKASIELCHAAHLQRLLPTRQPEESKVFPFAFPTKK